MDEYTDLTDIMKETPAVQPPPDFTQRVMGRIPDLKPGIWFGVRQVLLQPRESSFNLRRTLKGSGSVTNKECSFYFLMTGFFYLIMGIILMIGLKGTMSEMAVAQWIRLQPQIALITALWLIILGIALIMDGNFAVKAAKLGTLFYIGFAILNGLAIQVVLRASYAGIFILSFVGASVLMGILLAVAIQKTTMRLR